MTGKGFSKESIDLEHDIRLILDQQEKNGFAFDIKKAQELLAKLKDDIYDLENLEKLSKWLENNDEDYINDEL